MNRDDMFCDDTRWVKALNKLRNKRISEKYLSRYTLPVIHELQQCVLNKQFTWEVPYICKIPKGNGEYRECFALPLESRLVMSVIADVYYDVLSFQFSDHCVSYQTGISVSGIVRDVQNKLRNESVVGYKVDLSKYFDSVPEDKLTELLYSLDTGCVVDEYVRAFYADRRLRTKNGIIERYRSLCQGCALSPILADLYLQDVDYTLGNMCLYWRYSDDMLLIGNNAEEALTTLTASLIDFGLSLNPKKIVSLSDEFEFLGARIGNSIGIATKNLQELKQEIKHRCTKYPNTRDGQRKAILSLQRMFFKEDWEYHSLFVYYAGLVSGYEDFITLDRYCRQCIRSVFTGKHNFTTNLHKTPDTVLQELGWVSLVDMLNLYKHNREEFFETTRKIGGNHVFV